MTSQFRPPKLKTTPGGMGEVRGESPEFAWFCVLYADAETGIYS